MAARAPRQPLVVDPYRVDGSGRPVQAWVAAQHAGVQRAQVGPGLDAEPVGQQCAGAVVQVERLGPAARAVQGGHPGGDQAFPRGVFIEQRRHLGDDPLVQTRRQLGLRPVLRRGQPQFDEPVAEA